MIPKEISEALLCDEVVEVVAKRRAIQELYGHWENFPAKEANQQRRYEQLSEDVKDSYREHVREIVQGVIDAANTTQEETRRKALKALIELEVEAR